jgi:hypothetical protein
MLFPRKQHIRQFCVRRAVKNLKARGLFLEFGVFKGAGINLFAKELEGYSLEVYGFDSFVGLEEDWTGNQNGRPEGAYSLEGKVPIVHANAHLEVGWIQETFPPFLRKHSDEIVAFAHLDFDTFSPTEYALEKIKPRLVPGSIVLFDELYGYPGWRDHEFKALNNVLARETYEFICFSREAVGIEIR